ncbi:MAG TPA: NAD(P)H-binding protein [Gaiellaceae bacterium]|nr:NAD(P)H-binding protein [Gaiellaceae bacterium]
MSGTTLLTGATGYVGGRLLEALEEEGSRVRCLVRRPDALAGRVGPGTEVVAGDVLDAETTRRALAGVDVAYYLVHALASRGRFEDAELRGARTFAEAARDAGVARIVYLGGLGSGELSPHLATRQEVGRLLRASGAVTVEFRASIVIGAGSGSFELVRALADRLPVMVAPRWLRTPAQPIAIDDVIAYLVAARARPAGSTVYEIGGPDRVAYADLIRAYARARGLRRILVPVPLLSPRLSALWLTLVTPSHARVGRRLIESLRHATVVEDDRALEDFPEIRPIGVEAAITDALATHS